MYVAIAEGFTKPNIAGRGWLAHMIDDILSTKTFQYTDPRELMFDVSKLKL